MDGTELAKRHAPRTTRHWYVPQSFHVDLLSEVVWKIKVKWDRTPTVVYAEANDLPPNLGSRSRMEIREVVAPLRWMFGELKAWSSLHHPHFVHLWNSVQLDAAE